jgi:hypothetical protein
MQLIVTLPVILNNTLMQKYLLIIAVAFLPLTVHAQKTPEELGKYLFSYLKAGSISKIDSLIPTLEEMKALAEKLEIKKDSKQYTDAVDGYDNEVEAFRETISAMYANTLNNHLLWKQAVLQKVVAVSDSIKIDNRDPASKTAQITRLGIYFACKGYTFRISVKDAVEVNGLWKLGSNIHLKELH